MIGLAHQNQPRGEADGFEIIAHTATHITVAVPDGQSVIVRGIPYSARIQCHFWDGAWHVGERPEPNQPWAAIWHATYVRRDDWLQRNLKSSEASAAASDAIRKMAVAAARTFASEHQELLAQAGEVERNNRAHRKLAEIAEAKRKLDALHAEFEAIEAER